MLILSNCFLEQDGEGCIKVAQSLAKRCRERDKSTLLISLGTPVDYADEIICANKLFLSRKLAKLLKVHPEPVLYIPFSSGTPASILRTFLLSCMTGQPIKALFASDCETSTVFRWLLRLSGAEVITLSENTYRYYSRFVKKATYLQTGVDTGKFHPVDEDGKRQLRKKYGFGGNGKILLHVGHMREGRGLRCFIGLDPRYKIILVVSSVTKDSQEQILRNDLQNCPNIVLMEDYLPNIEEIYQLSDVYVFPVQQKGNCIEAPLSALEAMACGLPVAASDYGELKNFRDVSGVQILDSFDKSSLEAAVEELIQQNPRDVRQAVLKYDWDNAMDILMK